ncbi:MAG TPA: MlaD family protein [Candidatus Binatus sp.]|nr:MlaD family protein [Candidatus Binatus sp.]
MLTKEQRIGVFFIVGLILLFIAVELTLGLGVLEQRYALYANFQDVQGLDAGADVRVAGIKAGRVDSLRIENGIVRVKMAVDHDFEVRKDSVARLDFRALSGDRFVSISLGTPTAKRAEPGDTIEGEAPASFTDMVDKLAVVADSVTQLTENLDRNSQRLLGSLADLVEENHDVLGATAQNLASITGKLDRGTGTLGLLLNDPTLYERVSGTMGDVRQSVQDLGTVARNLSEGRSTLGKLVTQDDGLYGELRETVDNLNATARNAQEITDHMRQGEGTVGKALTDDSLYTEAQDTLRTVNRATQTVEDQSAISLLGTIVTSLF